MKGLRRSHRCTELSNSNIGETVTVMGWVQKRRNLGSLIFIDLRDRSGLLQIVFDENDVKTNTDYFEFIKENPDIADKTVYTGQIDQFFDYKFGPLEYRSVRFETEVLDEENYQGNAVVNYTSADVPYTRIIEHKHFNFGKQPVTIISREYSHEWKPGEEPYYPVNDEANTALFERYAELAEKEKKNEVYFGGRLGQYKYYNMDQVIAEALKLSEELL